MNPATKSNSAADSTPPAEPAESTSAEVTPGADTGEMQVTAADVAAALGLKPAGQETDDGETEETAEDTTGPDTEESDDGEEMPATAETADPAAGKSGEPTAESDAAAEPGESDTSEEPSAAAEGETPADEAPKKKNEHFTARIDELTKRAKTAEEEAAQLREWKNAQLGQQADTLEPGAVALVDTPQDLSALEGRYERLHEWALANPDGGQMPDGKGGQTEFNREQVAQINAKTWKLLNRALPERKVYLERRQAADEIAVQSYPWLKDRTSGPGAIIDKALAALPGLRQAPEYRLIAANAFVGNTLRLAGIVVDDALIKRLQAEQKAKQASGKVAPRAPLTAAARAPAAPGRTGTLPARRTPAAAQDRLQQKKLSSSSGSVDDLAQAIAAKMR